MFRSYDTPGEPAHRLAISGSSLYVTDGNAGVAILDSCAIFSDGFESGDTTGWSASTQP